MITVREFARLTTDPVRASIDIATIPQSAFNWLVDRGRLGSQGSGRLVQLDRPTVIRLGSYVGVVKTPCGTQIEILPKCSDGNVDVIAIRRLLIRMVSEAMRLTPRQGGVASIETFSFPLTEWVATQFLENLTRLIKRGLRQEYVRIEDRERFVRGRLDLQRQLRAGPGRGHLFDIQHDVFTFDRAENRLLRSALQQVLTSTVVPETWRIARELAFVLEEIPPSSDVRADFSRWGRDRLVGHYAEVRPWCDLILSGRMPFAIAGRTPGVSLLFPMERLFEAYVSASLRRQLPAEFKIRAQVRDHHLARYQDTDWFELKPDLLVQHGGIRYVLDVKWKRLGSDPRTKFDIDQYDFYQLCAYGQKYLGGVGDMFLIYPLTAEFDTARGPFHLSQTQRLHLVPFDLETRSIRFAEGAGLEAVLSTTYAEGPSNDARKRLSLNAFV